MDKWNELEQDLNRLTETGSVEVHEDGEWLAALDGFRWELRRKGKQALIHLWSPQTNLVRTIHHIAAREPRRIQLEVQRFGRARPARLDLLQSGQPRAAARISREQFRARFGRMLAEQFPDARVESLTTAADLKRSFSPLYTRGVMSEGKASWAVMGVSPWEASAAFEGILSFGLLWLDWTRTHAQRRAIEGLRLFLPEGKSGVTLGRARALRPSVGLEVFEFTESDWRIHRAEISGRGNVESCLTPRREVESILSAARDVIEKIRLLISDEPTAIEASVPSGAREVALRFRGLEFARCAGGQTHFGLGDTRRLLARDADWAALKSLLQRLSLKRSPMTSEIKDPLYRAAPERWLETLVLAEPSRLDAQLDPGYLYSQVPALAAGDRGVIDLLGVTRQGRLVVIELKASEDLQLPLQAVDYWLRVRRHLAEGDFHSFGYFSGLELSSDAPLIWLVAPSLRFHSTNEILLQYLAPELQLKRIGVSENWRRGLKVVFRQ